MIIAETEELSCMPGKDFFTTMKSFGETLLIILTSSPIVGCLQVGSEWMLRDECIKILFLVQ